MRFGYVEACGFRSYFVRLPDSKVIVNQIKLAMRHCTMREWLEGIHEF